MLETGTYFFRAETGLGFVILTENFSGIPGQIFL
jgi:hypothetical protein